MASIITNNIGRALAIGERLQAGLLHIKDQTVNDDIVNPSAVWARRGYCDPEGDKSCLGQPPQSQLPDCVHAD